MLEHSRQTKATRRKGEIHLSKDFSVGRGRQGEKLGICVDSVNLLLSVLSSLSSQPHRRQRDTGLCGWVGGAPLLTCGHSMQRGGVGCSRCCPRSSRSALSTCCQEEDGHFKGTAQTEARQTTKPEASTDCSCRQQAHSTWSGLLSTEPSVKTRASRQGPAPHLLAYLGCITYSVGNLGLRVLPTNRGATQEQHKTKPPHQTWVLSTALFW